MTSQNSIKKLKNTSSKKEAEKLYKSVTSNLDKLAKKNKVILQVGHLEQFNPAIIKLKKENLLEKG